MDNKNTKEKLFNPCYEHCFLRYGKEYSPECDLKCEYAKAVFMYKAVEFERDFPVDTLMGLAIRFCALMGCKNCPVKLQNYEKRTEYEKTCLHEPCFSNLHKWILEQAEKEKKEKENEENDNK